MKPRYNPAEIEPAVQKRWDETGAFKLDPNAEDVYYCLEMFPYPSGKLHMGHVRNYTIGDAVARFQRMNGRDVLYPMGFDSFGLPAENAARSGGGGHPRDWTLSRIEEMVGQMKRMGFSYDWDRKVVTCEPDYYRWNQWFFLKLWDRGLVYRKEAPVNWCSKCETVLANEQVHDGACWRHEDTPVIQKLLSQWFIKTSAYAERLLANLDELKGWPPHVLEMQRHWIGRSEGAILRFPVPSLDITIETFTTRPDTVYGITYLVLAPEHPLVDRLVAEDRRAELADFRATVAKQSSIDRMDATKPKHGYALGRDFLNPFTGTAHPLYVADYALVEYGTGAVMAVPAHDQRDFDFARRHDLPIRPVIHPADGIPGEMDAAYVEDGVMRDSGAFDGMSNREAWGKIVDFAAEMGWGRREVQYRLRDWLVSRQRYWGTPIPAIYCDKCGIVPAENLPVSLPYDVTFQRGGNPLETSENFARTKCPKCEGPARRETDTMDTFVDSSWYFLRYCDPKNDRTPFDPDLVRRMMPVDQYIGGVEHACMHLIYARFFTMALKDLGLVDFEEPFTNLLTQGMVSLETYRCPNDDYIFPNECVDGKCVKCGAQVTVGRVEKMSKSKKNTIDPGEMIERYGADTARTFTLFAAPPENELIWSDQAIEGSHRFLRRIFDLVEDRADAAAAEPIAGDRELRRKAHDTIRRVTRDISDRFQFNTAVAAMMELLNELQSHGANTRASIEAIEILLKLLSPIAPHLAEDRWTRLGKKTLIARESWPKIDDAALVVDEIEIPVQVSGKVRGTIRIPPDADEATAVAAAAILLKIESSAIRKVIYKQERILNLVM